MTTRSASAGCCCGSKTSCDCPKCTGLECLERPRFFAGQLLTETELNSQQDYVRAKNRLQNLHLHGWGVVCGLEVVCHECEGWVTVSPGYAIDPCGEDIIVCQEHPLNVIEMIRECKQARRRRRRADCEPRRPFDERRGKEVEEHWCITLSYAEKEARPTTALRRDSCGQCGCGPAGRCSCSCHGKDKGNKDKCRKSDRRAEVRSGVGKTVASCEPTRILETYCLDICEAPEDFCKHFESEAEKAWKGKFSACIDGLKKTFSRAPLTSVATLGDLQFDRLNINTNLGISRDQLTTGILHNSYCEVYDFLRELFRRNPGNAHCALIDRLDELDCPPPRSDESVDQYISVIRQPSQQLLGYLVIYLLDCFCWAAQPPCAPCCPGEDELILACLTVRGDKIEHICNFSCRRYAGAFPPTLWGIHLGPWMPILGKVLEWVCCGDLLDRILGKLKLSKTMRQLARYGAEDNFARPRHLYNRAQDFDLEEILGPSSGESLNLAALADGSVEAATAVAGEHGVELTVREVESVPPLTFLRALPAAGRGDRLVVYARQGQVLGFARPESATATLIAQDEELRTIKAELQALKAEIGRGAGRKPGKKSGKR